MYTQWCGDTKQNNKYTYKHTILQILGIYLPIYNILYNQ